MIEPFADLVDAHDPFPLVLKELRRPRPWWAPAVAFFCLAVCVLCVVGALHT